MRVHPLIAKQLIKVALSLALLAALWGQSWTIQIAAGLALESVVWVVSKLYAKFKGGALGNVPASSFTQNQGSTA